MKHKCIISSLDNFCGIKIEKRKIKEKSIEKTIQKYNADIKDQYYLSGKKGTHGRDRDKMANRARKIFPKLKRQRECRRKNKETSTNKHCFQLEILENNVSFMPECSET